MNDAKCIAHHGIKGQKWYVRRYQNEDGTLTEDGKKRYQSDSDSFNRRKLTKDIVKSLNRADAEKARYKIKKDGYERSEIDRIYSRETYADMLDALEKYSNDIDRILNLAKTNDIGIKYKDIIRKGYTPSQEYNKKVRALYGVPIKAIKTSTPGKKYSKLKSNS